MKKNYFIIIVALYFILNLINTIFLTNGFFNRYITVFNPSFSSIVCGFIGDFIFLSIFLLIGLIIFKKEKPLSIYLTVVTFILNVAIILLQLYSKSYKLAFSIFNCKIFTTPSGGFGGNIVIDSLKELFVYYRIVSLIPFFSLLAITISKRKTFNPEKIRLSIKRIIMFCTFTLFIQIGLYGNYRVNYHTYWGFSTEYAQYGCQYLGVYNYYFQDTILHIDNRPIDLKKNANKEYNDLGKYNKNTTSYINMIDNNKYSNKDKQTGILKGKNIFVIQMESTMTFCYNSSFNDLEVTPYFNQLFTDENCFYFNNAYSTVGIGNTSDAEFAFLTGYYPTGDMNISFEYADYDFDIPSYGDYLTNYNLYSYNPTIEEFYNHKGTHEGLYKMDRFRGVETFVNQYDPSLCPNLYVGDWIKDKAILEWARNYAMKSHGNKTNSFSFVETITPHTPFNDVSEYYDDYEMVDFGLGLNNQLNRYLNQVRYNDKMIYEFLMESSNPYSPYYLKDTVFILYGDHGNQLSKEQFEELYDKELTDFEYRKLLVNIPIIFYDPSGCIRRSLYGEDVNKILSQTKANLDMYRTLSNMLGIESNDYHFGINIFSGEPTFVCEPKNLDIITDDFMYCEKIKEHITFTNKPINMNIVDKILEYKREQDSYLLTLVYTSKKKQKVD